MTAEEDLLHVQNIIRSILEIEAYTKGMQYEDYNADEAARTGVAMNLSMIGNEAALMSDDFRNQYPELDLKALTGLQNANYNEEMEIDHHYVWHIATKDLPLIREKLSDVEPRINQEKDIRGSTQDTTRNNLK